MREHDFRFLRRGSSDGKPGEWHHCYGCSKEVFFPDGWTDFQKRLTVATAWMDDIRVLGQEELDRRVAPRGAGRDSVTSYHGVLSQDCDEAQRFVAEYVMIS